MADEKEVKENKKSKSKKRGFFSRIWNALFGLRGDDFEKRLQYISKEEATLISRIKRRSFRWRTTARNLIIFSLLLEMVAVGYAIMTTRTVDMDWRTRSLRVLPMFLLPALSFGLYYGLSSFTKFWLTAYYPQEHSTEACRTAWKMLAQGPEYKTQLR